MSDTAIWKDIKARLHDRAEEFVRWLFPAASKCSHHELAVGDLDGTPGDSLKIVVSGAKAGVWRDFSGSDGGNNLLDLLLKTRGLKPGEGLKVAADWLGIALPELPKQERQTERKRFVCAYDYRLASGELVHQTLRFELLDEHGRPIIDEKTGAPKKTFRQRRPAAQGMRQGRMEAKCDREGRWWIWTLEGIEPVLYHLPEMAARPDETVWIAEGEKDADRLLAAGLLSTTCPMGAGKWRPSYAEALRGRSVVLCGHSDVAGMEGMEKVGAALDPVCALVQEVKWTDVLRALGISGRDAEKWDVAKVLEVAG